MKDYREIILKKMLDKYDRRSVSQPTVVASERQDESAGGQERARRRIFLKPAEVYRAYDDYNADSHRKSEIAEAAEFLSGHGFIEVEYLPYSKDIRRMILVESEIAEAADWMETEYGILSRSTLVRRVEELCQRYDAPGLVKAYIADLREELSRPGVTPDLQRVEDVFRMLSFLEKNDRILYVREASMLVYGDSKYFEENTMAEVFRVLDGEDTVLARYHVFPGEQEIRIKGAWKISIAEETLNVAAISGGVSLSSRCFPAIRAIECGSEVMTVENKTSYERMPEDGRAYLYLGGFATDEQVSFLKLTASGNPSVRFSHFGDIDAGGFFIHRNLCDRTGISFQTYRMGIGELEEQAFANCLHPLTENDRDRLTGLVDDERYCKVVRYMLEKNVKLEQEIVSYYEK